MFVGVPAPAGECSDDEFFDNDSVAVDLCSSNAYDISYSSLFKIFFHRIGLVGCNTCKFCYIFIYCSVSPLYQNISSCNYCDINDSACYCEHY